MSVKKCTSLWAIGFVVAVTVGPGCKQKASETKAAPEPTHQPAAPSAVPARQAPEAEMRLGKAPENVKPLVKVEEIVSKAKGGGRSPTFSSFSVMILGCGTSAPTTAA